jgi:hypothetical protein
LISLDFDFKSSFFDNAVVKKDIDRRTQWVFARFGNYVRQAARKRIKKRKRKSRPGEGPTNQTGLLRGNIFFAYDKDGRTLVVGAQAIYSTPFIPERLEYGAVYRNYEGKMVTLLPRPYMRPAYEEKEPYLRTLWEQSVR